MVDLKVLINIEFVQLMVLVQVHREGMELQVEVVHTGVMVVVIKLDNLV